MGEEKKGRRLKVNTNDTESHTSEKFVIEQHKFQTLVHALQFHSQYSQKGITFIYEKKDVFISYTQFYSAIKKILFRLQQKGLQPEDKVILQVDDPIHFIKTFWACLLGGIVPVPLAVRGNSEHIMKLFRVWNNLDGDNRYIVFDGDLTQKLESFSQKNHLSEYRDMKSKMIDVPSLLTGDTETSDLYTPKPEKLAFLQYSSGTTGKPKGVMVTHSNLTANIYAMIHGSEVNNSDVFLNWMPLTHDMGLIGIHLMPSMAGLNQYIMTPMQFLRNPMLWLSKASQYKASYIASPNFGYYFFLKHFKKQIAVEEKWDLSRVKVIFNGAEPISIDLTSSFLKELTQFKLSNTAMYPVYGLAEATLAVSFPPVNEEPFAYSVCRDSLNMGDTIVEDYEGNYDCIQFVDVGSAINDCQLRIANDDDIPLEDNKVGHVQIKGAIVTQGYYNDQITTSKSFTKDGWFRTGDLGFLKQGRLTITGRAKDIIFINGQNFYSHDIERVAEMVNGIELGKIVATGLFNENSHTDDLLIFIQYPTINLNKVASLAIEIKKCIFENVGIEVRHVIPISKIYKTTSGKLQRTKLLESYNKGEYNEIIEKMLPYLKDHGDFNNNSINTIHKNQLTDFIEFKIQQLVSLLEHDIITIVKNITGQISGFLSLEDNLKELGLTKDKFILLNKIVYKKFKFQLVHKDFSKLHSIQSFIDYLYYKNEQILFNYYYDIKSFIKNKTSEVLKIEKNDISDDTDFTLYGITSLQGIQITNSIKDKFGTYIKNDSVFQYRSINSLTKNICEQITENLLNQILISHLSEEKDEIFVNNEHFTTNNIFLTGATGILGGYLLKDLLESTNNKIYCLIRAKNTHEAHKRIINILDVYKPSKEAYAKIKSHVVPIPGDITKDQMGVSPAAYNKLVKTVDTVIHAAAMTSLHGLYSQIKDINIEGTRKVIEFTKQTAQKYFVFISSYSVMGDRANKLCDPFTENDFDLGQKFDHLGYAQTKFESEYELRTHHTTDLKWIIFRPGNILGDSKNGYYPFNMTNTAGIFYDIFKTDIEKKFAMNNPTFFDITPVDYVSKAIMYLTLEHKKPYETYHLLNSDHKRFYEIIYLIKEYGYDISLLSTENYMEKLYNNKFTKDGSEYHSMAQDLFKFNPVILDRQLSNTETCYADNTYTRSILEKKNITCPRIDRKLIKTYLDYCRQIDYLPDPESQNLKIETKKTLIIKNNKSTIPAGDVNKNQYDNLKLDI